jgi:hypothetical protein
MRMRTMVVAVAVMIGATALAAGPGQVAAQLSKGEANALFKCQDTVAKAGQKFVSTKVKLLEQCGTLRVKAFLKCQAQDPKCAGFEADAAAKCDENFAKILPASTKFVDDVIKACQPVEDLLFDPSDPLAYQLLFEVIGAFRREDLSVTNVEELAGRLCAEKERVADLQTVVEVPAAFVDPSELALIPSELVQIEIDPRCSF